MTKKILTITLFALITVTSALAITPSKMSVDIPFDFTVANRVMPAGHYTLDLSTAKANGVMTITDRIGRSIMLTSTPSSAVTSGAEHRMVFHQHGDSFFLAEVAGGAGASARRLPRSKQEKELVSSTRDPFTVVAISAAR